MIKETKKQIFVLAAIASIGLSAPGAYAQVKDVVVDGKGEIPYVIDARNVVARSGAGLCWRTGYWSPAAASTAMAGQFPAGCECDADIVAKDKCVAPVAAAKPAPAPAPKPSADKIKLAADTLFDFDKATLKAEGRAKLDELAVKSKQLKLEVILAVGHTDRIGSDAYNQKLSERRAAAVKTYLVSKGVEANRVYTEGKGKSQPIADNRTAAGRAKNRRVEIEVVGTRPRQ